MAKQVYACEKCKANYATHTGAEACEESHCDSARDVADTLHKWMCRWNHTDGCGYFYKHANNADRELWLVKAEQVLAFARLTKVDVRTLILFLRTILKD